MPVLLQTHPNHSSSSTRERVKRCREGRNIELLSLLRLSFLSCLLEKSAYFVKQLGWGSAEALQDKYAHDKQRAAKCSSAAGNPQAVPGADTGCRSPQVPPHTHGLLHGGVDGGSPGELLLLLPF